MQAPFGLIRYRWGTQRRVDRDDTRGRRRQSARRFRQQQRGRRRGGQRLAVWPAMDLRNLRNMSTTTSSRENRCEGSDSPSSVLSSQAWILRHCDVMDRPLWAAGGPQDERRLTHSNEGPDCDQISERRRKRDFSAESVRRMIGRRRKSGKSEDWPRKDIKRCESFHLMQLALV
jgi:hypothetical protein